MAVHLGRLLHSAKDGSSEGNSEQIVELILKIWERRFHMPDGGPTSAFGPILAGLERLGDDSRWGFSRLPKAFGDVDLSELPASHLLDAAADLERVCRQTMIRLFWLASKEATEQDPRLLELADKVATNVESEVSGILNRLMARRRRLRDLSSGDEDDSVLANALDESVVSEIPDEVFNPELTVEQSLDRADEPDSPLSRTSNISALRTAADLLSRIADELERSASDER